ncbi:MAG: phosphoribosylanthranilate isomerase [Deltaproteobacteria bacterium]|nr:phosphoribosylanthranilate isomerase [Deltaproteobacteria bacterium]
MVRVKICGITRLEDALWAARCGVDALGFIFAQSPRRISPESARGIIDSLPPFVCSVGVFVNEARHTLADIAEFCGLQWIQLHGEEPPGYCHRLSLPAIKAFQIKDAGSLESIASYKGAVKGILLDTHHPVKKGGSGRCFDWRLAVEAKKFALPVILSGGLSPANIRKALQVVSPDAVDVNSGVEKSPGQKDTGLVKRFMQNIAWSKEGALERDAGTVYPETSE